MKKEHDAAENATNRERGLPSTSDQPLKSDGNAENEVNGDGDDYEEEDVGTLEETAEFETLMVWGHDNLIDEGEDVYFRGVNEMISLSEKVRKWER